MSIKFPKYLSIQTTSLCNGHCIFCPYDDIRDLFPKKIMEDNLFKKIIDECSQYKDIERIIFYLNNEPLTDPYIVERINYAKEKVPGASVHILTNGSLLTENLARRLIDSKLDWIGFSLHGINKDTIEKTMGINYDLTFERVLGFIEKAKEKRDIKDFIMVTFLHHKYLSLEEKEETMKFWQEKGIERISYFNGPVSRAGNVKDLPKVKHEKVKGCTSIWANEMLHILENGDVILCCMDWKREVILGNVNKQNIYEIWNSQAYTQIRNKRDGMIDSEDDFICKRCEAAILVEKRESTQVAIDEMKTPDILLVICPVWGVDMPPLGLAYIASNLKANNFAVRVLDFSIDIFNRVDSHLKKFWDFSYAEYWDSPEFFDEIKDRLNKEMDYCVNELLSSDCNLLGFSVYAPNRFLSIEVMRRIKKIHPEKIIVAGGRGVATARERKIFPEGTVDYFFIGEGEDSISEFLSRLNKRGSVDNLEGVVLFENRLRETLPHIIRDLDNLSYPTYQEFSLEKYRDKSLPLIMSRGCVSHCAFCDDWRLMGKFRYCDAGKVIDEIKHHIKKYGITNFYFNDPAINGNLKELDRLCDLIIQEGLKITWIALAIPFRGMTPVLLEKMYKAGCITLNYGIESGSERVLKLMRKMFSVKETEEVLKNTRKARINTQVNFIIGFPGEEEIEFQETLEFIKRNREYISGVTNLNTCNATLGSDLTYDSPKFGISFPEDGLLRDSHWVGQDNTYDIRKERAIKAINLLKELGIPLIMTNVFAKERKMDDILLVTLPPWGVENPPIGLGCLDSYLRGKGLCSQVYDFNIYFYNTMDDAYKMLWHVENKNFWSNEKTFPLICELLNPQINYTVDKILSSGVDLIGFSVVDPKERLTVEVIKRIKETAPNKKIILGGPACSTEEQRNFFTDNIPGYIDYFVVGEGEETLYQIIQREKNNLKKDNLSGIAIKVNEKWQYMPREPIGLESIPFPRYEGFDLFQYNGGKSLLVEWSRGCIGRCVFCKNYRLEGRYRIKRPENILKELEFLLDRYALKEFTVRDNIMNGDTKQLNEICDRIIKNGLKLRWSGQIAPRKEMDYDLLHGMYRAGCPKIQIGVESGSDKVLHNMRKIYTAEIAQNNIRHAKKAGMEVEVFIMVGFPGETEKEFRKTYDFIKRNAKYIDTIKSINTLHLIAGTDIYENHKKYNLKPLPERNWHYLWETYDGNTYEKRKERVERLLDLSYRLGIKVMETNIKEGKENLLFDSDMGLTTMEKMEGLSLVLNQLQELPRGKFYRRCFKKHSLGKFILLGFIFFFILFYMTYFWVFKKFKGKFLLGGTD